MNVAKHAGVDRATIRLARLPSDEVQVEVSDAGAGFDPDQPPLPGASGGIGLVSLSERLAHLGGRMEVYSSVGTGTVVRLIAPLDGGSSS